MDEPDFVVIQDYSGRIIGKYPVSGTQSDIELLELEACVAKIREKLD